MALIAAEIIGQARKSSLRRFLLLVLLLGTASINTRLYYATIRQEATRLCRAGYTPDSATHF